MAQSNSRHRLPGFDPALEGLRADVLLMGGLVRRSFANARAGFEQRDGDRCATVIADDEEVDLLEKQIDKAGTEILIRFAPLAGDLRLVLGTIKIGSILERLSDAVVAIARRARKLNQDEATDEAQAARPVFDALERSLGLGLVAFSRVDGVIAEEVRNQMESLAEQSRDLDERFSDCIPTHPGNARALVNLMAVAQVLEAIAYLLENLVEEVIYIAEGTDVRHPGNTLEIT
jgi:phosphate transport system protein